MTELKAEQDKIVKLQTYDLSLFIGRSYFINDEAQLYLIFQPLYYTLRKLFLKKLYHENLNGYWLKNLLLLPLLIIVFLHQLTSMEIQIFVYHLKEAA